MNAPQGIRLINRTDVLQLLLSAVSAMPPGAKVSIPRLRDALIDQGDVIHGLEMLIAAGELDRTTLRPPVKVEEPPAAEHSEVSPERETGRSLEAALLAYIGRHDLSKTAVARHLFGGPSGITTLGSSAHPRNATIAKVRGFVSAAPPEQLKRVPRGDRRYTQGASGTARALPQRHCPQQSRPVRASGEPSGSSPDPGATLVRRCGTAGVPTREGQAEAGANRPPPAKRSPAAAEPPAPTSLKPSEVAWCDQCEQRVSGVKAAACRSPWCKLKEGR